MMRLNINWSIRDDGVTYFEPSGMIESYFIYPPKYDDTRSNKYILAIIDNNGKVMSESSTESLAEAKLRAAEKLELTINILQNCCV